jgi:glycosyltransferase involved in cell wall biosynthesis
MIRVLTTCYNAKKYIGKCIDSLKSQTVDFRCYITDDISTDESVEYVEGLIESDERFILIKNTTKMYQPGNYWQVLQRDEIDDEDICVTVDGDDWLPNDEVLANVTKYYEDPNIWITCGQFLEYKGVNKYARGFTTKPNSFNNLRKLPWRSSHLRTFKAWLFREIQEEDLKAPNGNYWEVTGDLSFMFPMLEMAGMERAYYTQDINYIYNVETDLNDFKVNLSKQLQYANLIRAKKPYDYRTEHK